MGKKNKLMAIAFCLSLLIGLASCQSHSEKYDLELTISNPSSVNLNEKPVIIPREQLGEIKEGNLEVLLIRNGQDTLPSQRTDRDGDGSWDELFFLLDLPGNSAETIFLKWVDEAPQWEERTYVRFGVRPSEADTVSPAKKDTFYPDELPGVMGYQPYQTDGPSWENDKVGFRHYLDGRNSKDVFGKKISGMSPRNVGISENGVTEDNYHVMEAWGRDILSVGTSVGIGGYALMIKDKLARLGVTQKDSLNNVVATTFEILANGPIRSLMQFNYQNWKPENTGRTYQVNEETQIWPGFYGYKNSVTFHQLKGDETGLIGLVNINTDKQVRGMEVGGFQILYTHDKQTYEKEWYLGLALIIPKEVYQGWIEAPEEGQIMDSFLAKVQIHEGRPLDYYAIAAWELSDPRFARENYFKTYLEDLAAQLEVKPIIEISPM
ncbi:DUF4861 domain-containing protein [Echinicola jeungdonensis]|uniref:DUF4861 domain-containing protein n=1 Tax=Echinicola jeungdonensis TaxID=709343 RepID=A0ABV5JBI6_9BACT|nr:DUF4861 domain-containing protein [Echinicola jeungdonensis]MDN3670377.1 DUF4861 domain-containing protein [Echinicola jeungdonensis]